MHGWSDLLRPLAWRRRGHRPVARTTQRQIPSQDREEAQTRKRVQYRQTHGG